MLHRFRIGRPARLEHLFNQVDPVEVIFKKIEAIESREIMEIANEIFNESLASVLIYQ